MLVDFHAAPGDTTVASGNFIGDWQTLWRAITNLPNFSTALAGRVFLDLYNEPDGIGLRRALIVSLPLSPGKRDCRCGSAGTEPVT